jgi:hypothetical protein
VPHPRFDRDLARYNFFLFGYLNKKIRGTSLTPSDDRFFAIRQIFSEIPEIGLKNVPTNWITRLSWVMKKGGEYCTKLLKKNRIIVMVDKMVTWAHHCNGE